MFFKDTSDFIAIGDITTDAFIRLKEAHVHCDIDHAQCEISMKFADKIPFEFSEIVKGVGNAANAAVAASRLGLCASLITDIGDDQNGKDCLKNLRDNAVSTKLVSEHFGKVSNYHYVLWYEAERTILVNHVDYDYSLSKKALRSKPTWIYLTSLGGGTEKYHEQIATWIEQNPNFKLAFQPGTFQMKLGTEKLKKIYARSNVFICNKEEAQRILGNNSSDIKVLLSGIKNLGPEIVLISDGPKGAYMFDSTSGNDMYFMPIYPDPKPPYERTGCGDAFAATFVTALALGKTSLEALTWGPVNSMSVVQYVGAQKGLLNQELLKGWLAQKPADYTPKKI